MSTPRVGGHPDLNGNWVYTDWIGNYMTGGGRRCAPTQPSDCNRQVNQTYDFELYSPSRFGNMGRPVYKPAVWDKVQQLDMWTNKYDPVMTCQPLGVPREGPPRRIYQSDKDVTFIYLGGDAGGGYGEYRVIPTDGRKHDPNKRETTYLGYTVGRWEGDTLVLDSIKFNDATWLRARRVLPLRRHARHRAVHTSRRRASVRRHGRGPRSARGAVGAPDAHGPAQL